MSYYKIDAENSAIKYYELVPLAPFSAANRERILCAGLLTSIKEVLTVFTVAENQWAKTAHYKDHQEANTANQLANGWANAARSQDSSIFSFKFAKDVRFSIQ